VRGACEVILAIRQVLCGFRGKSITRERERERERESERARGVGRWRGKSSTISTGNLRIISAFIKIEQTEKRKEVSLHCVAASEDPDDVSKRIIARRLIAVFAD